MQLQIPICAFDAKTGILCPICESKLQTGQIREADVHVSKALLQVTGNLHGTASLVRSFRVEGDYVLELDNSGLVALRNNPDVLAELEKRLSGRVYLARASSSTREFMEDLLNPVKVIAIDTVWLPDGTKLAKAIVTGRIGRQIRSLELIKRLAKEARGIDLVVESDEGNRFPETSPARNPRMSYGNASSLSSFYRANGFQTQGFVASSDSVVKSTSSGQGTTGAAQQIMRSMESDFQ
ncbi:MAG: hypothetical protein OK449_05020 [Thaumarchaeota archaeon]|nr:hypothetical protein [Nitrososphaerota archaeon]